MFHVSPAIQEFKKRTKRLKLERYRTAIAYINEVRELQGKSPLLSNTERFCLFEDWVKIADKRQEKTAEKARIRDLKNHLKDGLRFVDPANKNGLYYSQYNPISLKIDGNRVRTSNNAEVSIKSAKTLLVIWKKAISNRTTYANKEMSVDGIQGVCIRRNGTVKIGCTRILPDAVRKLSLELV